MANVVLVNEKDELLGEVAYEQAHKDGLCHRASVVYLVNSNGEILLQERANGGEFDHSSAGHVDPGESYLEAAKRELWEELGVKGIELKEIGQAKADEPKPHIKKYYRHQFRIFECMANPGRLEPKEVKSVLWSNPREVWQDMMQGIPSRKYCGGFKATLEVWLKAKGLL